MVKVLVLHGPNLHLLGQRQNEIYGEDNLETINYNITKEANKNGFTVNVAQSNSEHEIIDIITNTYKGIDYMIFNPAAFTHTSIAIYDTLLATKTKFIEVHLSNIDNREDFRRKSYFSPIAIGTISGFGSNSYLLALDAIKMHNQQYKLHKEQL